MILPIRLDGIQAYIGFDRRVCDSAICAQWKASQDLVRCHENDRAFKLMPSGLDIVSTFSAQ